MANENGNGNGVNVLWKILPWWVKAVVIWGPLAVVFFWVLYWGSCYMQDERAARIEWDAEKRCSLKSMAESVTKLADLMRLAEERQTRLENDKLRFQAEVAAGHEMMQKTQDKIQVAISELTGQTGEQTKLLDEINKTLKRSNGSIE